MKKEYTQKAAVVFESAADLGLMCFAKGCPNRWAAETASGKLCSAHHSASDMPHLWPQITREQADLEVNLALERGKERAVPQPLTRTDKTAILAKLQTTINHLRAPKESPANKAWAYALRDRELNHNNRLTNGKKLIKAQRDMWRAALPPTQPEQNSGTP
jgi:hypothetical protein